jgi:hypothetical protein
MFTSEFSGKNEHKSKQAEPSVARIGFFTAGFVL